MSLCDILFLSFEAASLRYLHDKMNPFVMQQRIGSFTLAYSIHCLYILFDARVAPESEHLWDIIQSKSYA